MTSHWMMGGKYRAIQPIHLDNLKKLPPFSPKYWLKKLLPTYEFPIMKYLMELNRYLFIFIYTTYNT